MKRIEEIRVRLKEMLATVNDTSVSLGKRQTAHDAAHILAWTLNMQCERKDCAVYEPEGIKHRGRFYCSVNCAARDTIKRMESYGDSKDVIELMAEILSEEPHESTDTEEPATE